MLSHPVPVFALVGRYPTNKLIGHGHLLGRIRTFGPKTSSGITGSFPPLSQSRGQLTMHYSPLRRFPCIATVLARLACLIHAANVHSEPGSNPSIDYALVRDSHDTQDLTPRAKIPGTALPRLKSDQFTGLNTCSCHRSKVAHAI
jgi:hypothetical protein